MRSVIKLCDDSYEEFQANVTTKWGSTFLRAYLEEDFITALLAVLPLTAPVYIVEDICSVSQKLICALHSKRYKVFVEPRKM